MDRRDWFGRVCSYRVASVGLSLAAASVMLVAGCAPQSADAPAAAQSASSGGAKTVGVVTPTIADVSRTLTQPATIQGIEEATLYARVAGYVKSILVDKGDRIRAGQLLAVVDSPELRHQQSQALSTVQQSQAATLGVVAAKGRAEADFAQAGASVEKAKADARSAQAAVKKAQVELARTEAQIPRLKALAQEADANAEQAAAQRSQEEAGVERWKQQVLGVQAALRAAQSNLEKAQADARLQQATFNRLKAIQDKDSGLIPAQQVDEARARQEVSQSEVTAARGRLEVARQEVATVEQQLEGSRRGVSAAAKRIDALRNRAEAARAEIKIAEQDVAEAREQVTIAQAQAEAAQRGVVVAEAQRRSLGSQVRVANAQIGVARQQTSGSRSALSAASAMADYTQIKAPFNGVVAERIVDPGALVHAGAASQASSRGILRVVRDDRLRVLVPVPETVVPHIRRGKVAVVTTDAYPKQPFTGTVTRFAGAVDPKTRTLLTEVDIPNAGQRLRPGMFARVTLTLEVHANALSIPTEAITGKDDDRFVYTVVDGQATKTPIKVGIDDGKMAEILEGLDAKSQVVVTGKDSLVNGAAVKTEPAKLESGKK